MPVGHRAQLDAVLRRFGWVIVGLVVLVVYAPSVDAPFLWDDRHLILDSDAITSFRGLAYFGEAFWSSPESGHTRAYYRPVTVLSLALDRALHGTNPAGFHLTNVALHSASTALLFAVLRRYRVQPAAAVLLSLLWGLHPRSTEAAAWVSGRTDVLAATFLLLGLAVYRGTSLVRSVGAALCLLLGLLSKEVALAGVLALLATELVSVQHRGLARARGLLPLGAVTGLYVWLRARALSSPGAEGLSSAIELGVGERALAAVGAAGHYLTMLAVPWTPALQHGDIELVEPPYAILGGLGLVGFGALAARWLTSSPPRLRAQVAAGLALVGGGLGLVLHVIPISVRVLAADRFLYVPLLGACVSIGAHFRGRTAPRRWLLPAALCLLASFVVSTSVRVADFASEVRLWSKSYHQLPKTNAIAGTELGNLYYRAGLYEEAKAIYERTAERTNTPMLVRANHANALSQLGDYARAEAILSASCSEHRHAKYCLDAGLVALHRLDLPAAEALVVRALELAPEYRAAQDVLRLLPEVRAAIASARSQPESTLAHTAARFHLARIAGRRLEALALGRELLARREAPPGVRRQAAEYWLRMGSPAELAAVLSSDGPATDVLDDTLLIARDHRLLVARELLDVWPGLGIDSR